MHRESIYTHTLHTHSSSSEVSHTRHPKSRAARQSQRRCHFTHTDTHTHTNTADMSKLHSRSAHQVFGDENAHLAHHHGAFGGGLNKHATAGNNTYGGNAHAQDAKRGRLGTTGLPSARSALGDISNRSVAPLGGDAIKKAGSVTATTTFPAVHTARQQATTAQHNATHNHATQQPLQPIYQHQQPAAAAIDPMDTTLEENIADLSLSPSQVEAHTVAPAPAAPMNAGEQRAHQIDQADRMDTQLCSEYASDITRYWRAVEMRRAPNPNYMKSQNDINPRMREILVDWMVEVQVKFRLKQETLYLSIHLLDRFLERRLVNRNKLQLVGCTALLLAAKYEEMFAPEVADFVAISDNAYTREQILAMEGIMLNALSFNLTVPSPLNFLQRFSRLAGVAQNDQVWFMSCYYMELTLQQYQFLNFSPSCIAASALFLALGTVRPQGTPAFSSSLQQALEYTPQQLSACVTEMFKHVDATQQGTSKYKAVKKKYSLPKHGEVAKYLCKPPQL